MTHLPELPAPFDGPYGIEFLAPDSSIYNVIRSGQFDRTKVYVDVDADGSFDRLCFACPCGKHSTLVELNLDVNLKQVDPSIPCWSFLNFGGKPDVTPSIHRTDAIGCHFYLKQGMVHWC